MFYDIGEDVSKDFRELKVSLIIKHRMLEIDRELGAKKIPYPAPLVSYTASKTKISWEPKNQVFKKHQTLEFQW